MNTIQEVLTQGRNRLGFPTVLSAHLDAQVLLCHVLRIERSTLYAHPEQPVTSEQEHAYFELIRRRSQHEPVAYLTGLKEFYGRQFVVDQRVLIPRPETELLIEKALDDIRQRLASGTVPVVADIGTGSGAIPITLALEEPRLPAIYACDISSDALAVAELNCQRLEVASRVRLLQGDLLAPLPEAVDVLLANLPYIGTEEELAPDVQQYEPYQALYSGPHGLDLVRRLCEDALQSGTLKEGGMIVLEIGYQQREALTHLTQLLWPEAKVLFYQDYAGLDRFLQIWI